MKRHNNLYSQIYAFENLHRAYLKARKQKRYQPNVLCFGFDLEEELLTLEDELKNCRYRPGKYKQFTVCDPKQRQIKAPPFRDRVIHHAICNIIEPIFDKAFIYDSYACRKGKGTHKAIDRLTIYLRKINTIKRESNQSGRDIKCYCLKCDIHKYFASIDHENLLRVIKHKIKDPNVIWLSKVIIDSHADEYVFSDRTSLLRKTGIPIGSLTSQIFANIYLNQLDYFIKCILKARYYIRYMDDFIILDFSKKRLSSFKSAISEFLWNKLFLKLNKNKTSVFPIDHGIDFLGYRIWHDHRKLRRENVRRFKKKLKNMKQQYLEGEITLPDLESSTGSWIAHALHADTYYLRQKLFSGAINTQNQ